MAVEKKFIDDAIARYLVLAFLKRKLERYGFSGVKIQRTPMVTRITVEVANPGRLIGKRGRSIRRLTDVISKEFGITEPQIAVIPIEKIELEPRLMAKVIARRIEAGKPLRPTVHMALKRIMDAGALGAEIVVSGKIVSKGGKARSLKAAAGYLPKAGEITRLLKQADVTARPKAGAVNVRITIAPPGTFPEKVKIELPSVIKYAGAPGVPPVTPPGAPPEAPEVPPEEPEEKEEPEEGETEEKEEVEEETEKTKSKKEKE